MREAAENTLSEQSTTKVTLECKTPNYKENIGVYQWVVSTSDNVYRLYTHKYLCKYGVGFDKPPRCPLGACADNDCNVCEDW